MSSSDLIVSEGKQAADTIFDAVNNSFTFGGAAVRTVIVGDDPWFSGNDVAAILGYSSPRKAIQDNVDIDDKRSLDELATIQGSTFHRLPLELNGNERRSTFINEAGLYALIMRSKLKIAKQFQKWVCGEVLPSIRKTRRDQEIQRAIDAAVQSKDAELKEAEEKLHRLHILNIDLLSFKKAREKTDSIYINSLPHYAKQGLYKIGRTKNPKARISSQNSGRAPGDKLKIFAEFKVADAVLAERVIHAKLEGLRPDAASEFFMCPFNLLVDVIELIISQDDIANEAVGRVIDTVFRLRTLKFRSDEWTVGVDEHLLRYDAVLTMPDGDEKAFDLTQATNEQKQAFVNECFLAYQRTITASTVFWMTFQEVFKNALPIPKGTYKASHWKPFVKNAPLLEDKRIRWTGSGDSPAPPARLALPAPSAS